MVKVTGSQSVKHIEGDRVAGVSYRHSIDCPASSLFYFDFLTAISG